MNTQIIKPTVESVVETLTQSRLLDLCKLFGCEVREAGGTKERLVHISALRHYEDSASVRDAWQATG